MKDYRQRTGVKVLATLALGALGLLALLPMALNIFLAPVSLVASVGIPFLFVRLKLLPFSANMVGLVFVAGLLVVVLSSLPVALVSWIAGLSSEGEPLAMLALATLAGISFVLARFGALKASEQYAS